jgi:hypothetical protein
MKGLNGIVSGYSPPQTTTEQAPEINPIAVQIINKVFAELQVVYPAWKQAFPDERTVGLAKKVWIKTFAENGVGTIEQVKLGMAKARADASDFVTSAGKFCAWCNAEVDADESFDRLIARDDLNAVERLTAQSVGYKCRSILKEADARKAWKKALLANYEKQRNGTLDTGGQKLLTQHVAAKPTDTMRDQYTPESEEAKKMIARFNKMRNK